jgi:hypothetical protein
VRGVAMGPTSCGPLRTPWRRNRRRIGFG